MSALFASALVAFPAAAQSAPQSAPQSAGKAGERTVTIESARTSEYLKGEGEAGAGEIIRFTGDVILSVSEGSSVSRISADEITYDKTRDTLEARGHVTYVHSTGGSGSEKFTGEALRFNIARQEGVFLKGVMSQTTGKSGSDPYVIHSETSGRDGGSTMAFRDAMLTTCDEEDPHWSINASRIWLLPGNEIALLNGVFFIGPLPVFYLPAFYYPADEMIFHPVFGFRNREGYFTQTTTYLVGRKPLETKTGTSSSFSDFLKSDSLMEQKRNGLFLMNTDEKAKKADSDYLKLMADAYSSLGAMIGIDGSFSPKNYVRNVDFSAALGFSRTLYLNANDVLYTPYSDGRDRYDAGWFFGNKLPFRYRASLSLNMDKAPFQVSVSLPLMSDPEFKPDFFDRSEDLNWFSMMMDRGSLARGAAVSQESSYSWSVSGSIRPAMTATSPWLSSFSVPNLSGLITFNSRDNAALALSPRDLLYSPERKFYYPDIIKPAVSLSLGGTIFSSQRGGPSVPAKKPADGSLTGSIPDPFRETDQAASAGQDSPRLDSATVGRFLPEAGSGLVPPVAPFLTQYSVTWALDPSVSQEIHYDNAGWTSPDDIDWNSFSSMYYQLKTTGRLNASWTLDSNLVALNSALAFTGSYQDHPLLSGSSYDTDAERNNVRIVDYKANVYALTTTDSLKVSPFNRNALLKPFSLGWNFSGDLVKTVFDGSVDQPSWKTETLDWSDDSIDSHNASLVAGLALGNYEQKVTVTSNLPPLLQSYTGSLSLGWSFVSLTAGSRLYQQDKLTGDWNWDPFRVSASWTVPPGIRLAQEYVYSIEDDKPTRLNFTGAWGGLSGHYTLNSSRSYRLEPSQGWVQDTGAERFIPSAAGLSFTNSSSPLKLYGWKNRVFLQASFNSNLSFNLLKLTDSSFTFSPAITFKILDFLDFSLGSTSSNEVIARYFQDWMDLPEPLGGETNLFVDLAKSFNFASTQDRSSSGFKLKALNMALTHYLHDWTMNLTAAAAPELKTENGRYYYEFSPTITFVVSWKPISDIKTTVKSEKGVFTLNTAADSDSK